MMSSTPPMKKQDDFPFYNGVPVAITVRQWLMVLSAVAVGFACVAAPVEFFKGTFTQMIPAVLFVAIPLLVLAFVVPQHWRRLFRKVGRRDIAIMFGVAGLNIVVSLSVGMLVMKYYGAEPNPAIELLANATALERVAFFVRTLPQLLGEEIFSILPFLAVMTFATSLKMSRSNALWVAWLVTALIFGAAHLPTYGWNVLQCLLVIGSARLVLLLAYITTKNIWVSTGAHVINDWFIFLVSIFGAMRAIAN